MLIMENSDTEEYVFEDDIVDESKYLASVKKQVDPLFQQPSYHHYSSNEKLFEHIRRLHGSNKQNPDSTTPGALSDHTYRAPFTPPDTFTKNKFPVDRPIKEASRKRTSIKREAFNANNDPPDGQIDVVEVKEETNENLTAAEKLRSKIKSELENRAKLCLYRRYKCTSPRLRGYDYCHDHILEDSQAPYKQCNFVYVQNSKRCRNPVFKQTDSVAPAQVYCPEHTTDKDKSHKDTLAAWKRVDVMGSLLTDLSPYVKDNNKTALNAMEFIPKPLIETEPQPGPSHIETVSGNSDSTTSASEDGEPHYANPLTEIDFQKTKKMRSPFEYGSESDSDEEPLLYGDVKKHQCYESDNDSYDEDDPLKYAGVYTYEEVNNMALKYYTRLRQLYVEQLQILQHDMRQSDIKYAKDLKAENEEYGDDFGKSDNSMKAQKLRQKLHLNMQYGKKSGIESILHERSLERRAKLIKGGEIYCKAPVVAGKCIFTEGGVKCGEEVVALTKHCPKHIMEDKQQILFKTCGVQRGDDVCQEPIIGQFNIDKCPEHDVLLPPKPYNIRKDETDSENEEDATSEASKRPATPCEDNSDIDSEESGNEDEDNLKKDIGNDSENDSFEGDEW